MNKRIVYTNDDETVSIIVPAISVELALKDVPTGKEYHIVEDSDIPSDRTFRDAWVLDGDTIKVDAEKQAVIQTKQVDSMTTVEELKGATV